MGVWKGTIDGSRVQFWGMWSSTLTKGPQQGRVGSESGRLEILMIEWMRKGSWSGD